MENKGEGEKIGGRRKDEVEKEAQKQEERRWKGGGGLGDAERIEGESHQLRWQVSGKKREGKK